MKAQDITFSVLCKQYNLPETHEGYFALMDFFDRRQNNKRYTEEEIASDFTAMELAKMLLLLQGTGSFRIEVAPGHHTTISDKKMIDSLVGYLTGELSNRIQKSENIVEDKGGVKKCKGPHLILCKGYGGGGTGRAYLIPYPPGSSLEKEGFSEVELKAIIKYEKQLKDIIDKYAGNKNTRNPEIGKLASWILSLLPGEWIYTDRNCFVFDYLLYCGFLDFKGDDWKMKFFVGKSDRKRKSDQVDDWISSYRKLIAK